MRTGEVNPLVGFENVIEAGLVGAAGPAVNFMLAGIWALRLEQELTIRGSAFWAANLLTGGFNLLPVPPLDGAQLASCLCEMRRAGKKFKGND